MNELQRANDFVEERRIKLNTLRINSPYYPQIASFVEGDREYLSTLVRIERNGVWYAIHVEHDFMANLQRSYEMRAVILQKMVVDITKIQYFYMLQNDDVPDKIQISEKDRLLEYIKKSEL